ncbi:MULTISPECIES: hypothetical protein [unclassified Mucilaginibacter]|uniref:hypothetical protein n=1 Tax=unclassified Mucilaginibacter TaxID=2617802 RepID=UPI0031F6FFC0
MKLLLVRPVGGIANRMRVLESAYKFSKAASLKLVVLWERNGNLNAKYSECFEPVPNMTVIELNLHGSNSFAKVKRRLLTIAIDGVVNTLTSFSVTDVAIENEIRQHGWGQGALNSYFDNLVHNHSGIYIDTCYEFYTDSSNFQVQIAQSIQRESQQILLNLSSVTGVHIRRSDNINAIEKSPLDAFVNEISCTIAINPEAKFYLSTDSQEVTNILTAMFPGNIITGISVRTRDSKAGIIAALTDLCCLSMCREIWGSHDSSFSGRAAKINNIPLRIILQYAE